MWSNGGPAGQHQGGAFTTGRSRGRAPPPPAVKPRSQVRSKKGFFFKAALMTAVSLLLLLRFLASLTWTTFKKFLRLCSLKGRYQPPRTLTSMGTRYPRIPWAGSRSKASTPNPWTYRNPNPLVDPNPGIVSDVNKELHILVINWLIDLIIELILGF